MARTKTTTRKRQRTDTVALPRPKWSICSTYSTDPKAQTEADGAITFQSLPDDVLPGIFRHCDVRVVKAVCHRWRDALAHTVGTLRLGMNTVNYKYAPVPVTNLLRHLDTRPTLQNLIVHVSRVHDGDLDQTLPALHLPPLDGFVVIGLRHDTKHAFVCHVLTTRSPRVVTLHHHCSGASSQCLDELTNNPRLERLTISYAYSCGPCVTTRSAFRTLTHLDIYALKTVDVEAFATMFPVLEHFRTNAESWQFGALPALRDLFVCRLEVCHTLYANTVERLSFEEMLGESTDENDVVWPAVRALMVKHNISVTGTARIRMLTDSELAWSRTFPAVRDLYLPVLRPMDRFYSIELLKHVVRAFPSAERIFVRDSLWREQQWPKSFPWPAPFIRALDDVFDRFYDETR